MRVLIVSPYFPPQHATASLRVHSFATRFVEAGHDLTVLSTAKRDDQRGLDLPCPGAAVVEVPFATPRWLESLRRADRPSPVTSDPPPRGLRSGAVAVLRAVRARTGIYSSVRRPDLTDAWVAPAVAWCRDRDGWDVVLSSSGPYTAHEVALALVNEGRARAWVADFRDLWVGHPFYHGLFPFTLRERALERRCLAAVHHVVAVSEDHARVLRARTAAPVTVISNGFSRREVEALPGERAFPDDGCVRLVYTGTLYPTRQDPRPLLEALAQCRADAPELGRRLRLVVAGRGGEVWRRLADRAGAGDAIETPGTVDRSTALRMQRDADALVHLDWRTRGVGALGSKLCEYLHARAPILVVGGSPDTPAARLVSRAGRGVPVGTDARHIVGVLRDLVHGRAGGGLDADRDFIEQFSRERQAGRLLDLAQAIASPAETST